MKRLILSLFAVCSLWMANAQNPAWGPQSKVVTDSIYSTVLKTHRAYTIYLPQSYDKEADRKYPILYLLHGMSGVNTSWFTDQRVKDVMDQLTASGEACEMIIVSPTPEAIRPRAGTATSTCRDGLTRISSTRSSCPISRRPTVWWATVSIVPLRAFRWVEAEPRATRSAIPTSIVRHTHECLMNIPVSVRRREKTPTPQNKMAVLSFGAGA